MLVLQAAGLAAERRQGSAPGGRRTRRRVRFRMRTGAGARAAARAAARDAIIGMVCDRLARYHLEAAKAAMQELGAEVAAGAMHGQHATITRSSDRGTYWSGSPTIGA